MRSLDDCAECKDEVCADCGAVYHTERRFKLAQYKKCPDCGANNDPGEKCDCKDERNSRRSIDTRKIGEEARSVERKEESRVPYIFVAGAIASR
jgi:hypothetical protein